MTTDEQSFATTATSIKPENTGLSRARNVPMIQNFHLVWLDGSIDENNDEYRNLLVKLREVVYTVMHSPMPTTVLASSMQPKRQFL